MVLQGSFSLLLSQSALWWWELLSQQNSCLQLVTWKAPRENFCYYLSLHDLNCLHLKHMTVTAVKSRAWWCLGEKNIKFWSLVGFSCHVSAAGAEGLPALFKSKPQKSVSVSTRSVSDVPVSLVGLHICSSLTSVLPQFCLNTRNVFHLHSQQVFSFFLSFSRSGLKLSFSVKAAMLFMMEGARLCLLPSLLNIQAETETVVALLSPRTPERFFCLQTFTSHSSTLLLLLLETKADLLPLPSTWPFIGVIVYYKALH